jgi:hypothetical protein
VAKSASRLVTSRSVISSSPSRFAVGSSFSGGRLTVPGPGDVRYVATLDRVRANLEVVTCSSGLRIQRNLRCPQYVLGASAPAREREAKMKARLSLFAAGLFVALSVPAVAFQCPSDMAKIDTTLATASLSEQQLDQVKQLRADGERLHNERQHQESIDTLAQAKTILGIE